jgi:hypothetical protein
MDKIFQNQKQQNNFWYKKVVYAKSRILFLAILLLPVGNNKALFLIVKRTLVGKENSH